MRRLLKPLTSVATINNVPAPPVYSVAGCGKIILTWTEFKWTEKDDFIECGPYRCFITNSKKLLHNSSAVLFHLPARQFFYDLHKVRTMNRPPGQYWILYNREAPGLFSQRESLINRHCNSLFNWTMTYKFSSGIRFGYAEIIPGKFKGGYDPNENYLKGRTKMAIALISNCAKKIV